MLQDEQHLLGEVLSGLFGYHLLQLGDVTGESLLSRAAIAHRMLMAEGGAPLKRLGDEELVHGDVSQLPLTSGSVDVVVMPHLLEYQQQPHQVLREVERVLIPEGHVVILCFNPWSLFGVRRLLQGWREHAPWSGHFYTPMRLKDWLSLLGFDTVQLRYYFHRPPLQQVSLIGKLWRMEELGRRFFAPLGGGYLLVAKKRVATLTPIKPRWRTARSLINVGVTETSARRDEPQND